MGRAWVSTKRLKDYGMLGMNCRNVDFINRYNERRLFPMVDNKLKTKLLAQEYDVPTPALKFVVSEQHEIRHIERELAGLESFALKPAKGSGGKGILIVTGRQEDLFVRNSGALMDISDIRRHMSNILAGLYSLGGSPDVAIVEDLIAFDDSFAGYSYEGVPDIRIIVFRGYPVMAMLRLATHASDGKANLHQGAVGVGLALDTGCCLNAAQFGRPIKLHPDTGRPLSDIQISGWRDILLLASQCYDMTGLGYIGTDIVLDKFAGPQLLELNARPGLSIQITNGRGLLPRLRHIENMTLNRRFRTEHRVDYSMRQFAEVEVEAEPVLRSAGVA